MKPGRQYKFMKYWVFPKYYLARILYRGKERKYWVPYKHTWWLMKEDMIPLLWEYKGYDGYNTLFPPVFIPDNENKFIY